MHTRGLNAGSLLGDGGVVEPDFKPLRMCSDMEYDGDGSGCKLARLRRSYVSRNIFPFKGESVKKVRSVTGLGE